jgi:hypothetical protein
MKNNLNNFFIAALILIAMMTLYQIEAFKPFTGRPDSTDKYTPFCNLNLTTYDIGCPAVSNIYKYWTTIQDHWNTEYNGENVSTRIDSVRSTSEKNTSLVGKTRVQGIHPDYYHDPSNFEKIHPGKSYYHETNMPYQEPVDNVSTANHRVIEDLKYNGIKIYTPLKI